MIPRAAVVPGPSGGIALCAGVGCSSKDERTLSSLQFQQAFVSGASVFHTEDVVSSAMVYGCAVIETMDSVEGHGLIAAEKDRGLVHVVPKTGGTHGDEIVVQATP